jgi:hypothetical protein
MIGAAMVAWSWVKRALKNMPWQLRFALAVAAFTLVLARVHTAAVDAAFARGRTTEAAARAVVQAKADQLSTAQVITVIGRQADISKETTIAHDEVRRSIYDRADLLRLRHDAALRSAPGNLPASGNAPAIACKAPPSDGLAWDVALPLMRQAALNDAQLNAILDEVLKQDALAAER